MLQTNQEGERTNGDIEKVEINRGVKVLSYPFSSVFGGFDRVRAVRKIFGAQTKRVLAGLRVALYRTRWGGYMWIDDKNKCLVCNLDYLRSADKRYLYLDVIHELVHVRQMKEGKELFDDDYKYLDRPTEIEAYRVAIDEAKRMGMSKKEIVEYLKVEWVSRKELAKFLKRVKMA